MAAYWAWMTEHWFWGGLLSFILALAAIQAVKAVLVAFFKIFHRKEPPKVTIEVRDREVSGGESAGDVIRDIADHLTPEPVRRTSAWERLRGGNGI